MTNLQSKSAPAKHTPGPWQAVSLRDEVNVQPAPGMPFERTAIINHVFGGANFGEIVAQTGCNYPRCQANARLIAAAPDMLAACDSAIQIIEQLIPEPSARGIADVVLVQIRRAIAKAEGGAA